MKRLLLIEARRTNLAPMQRLAGTVLLFCVIINTARGLPCLVQSTNHGSGWFSYTFRRGDDPYVWGVGTNIGLIRIQSYGVLEVRNPPQWSHTVSPSGLITWTVTNGIVVVDDVVTFGVRSCLTESTTYSGFGPAGPFGVIGGVVFTLPDHQGTGFGGFQAFDFVGPAVPDLSIQRKGPEVILCWSTKVQGFRLEGADQPLALGSWKSVSKAPIIEDSKFMVILPATNAARFFRLVAPCTPALPSLSIQRSGLDVIIRWSTEAQGFQLEAADDLQASASWQSVTNAPIIEATNFRVTLPAAKAARFFRLVAPCKQGANGGL